MIRIIFCHVVCQRRFQLEHPFCQFHRPQDTNRAEPCGHVQTSEQKEGRSESDENGNQNRDRPVEKSGDNETGTDNPKKSCLKLRQTCFCLDEH